MRRFTSTMMPRRVLPAATSWAPTALPLSAFAIAPRRWAASSGGCPFTGTVTTPAPLHASIQSVAASGAAAASSATSTAAPAEAAEEERVCPFSGTSVRRASGAKEQCPMEVGDDERDAHGGSGKTDMYSMINALGKSKLSAFVTSTATVGYVMCGGASPIVGTVITLGTYLQSLSANTCNQVIEVEHDGRMKRTMKRPLVTGAISRPAALGIAALELSVGTAMIYYYSPLAAGLGVLNWALYVGLYTPLKRVSTTNTWWGAIVGAIPPVMGGAAALPGISMADPLMYPAHLLGALLFAWQIPHFMSLAYHCRRDYEGAGYKMLPYTHPWRASAYAVALSVVMAILSVPAPYFVCPVVEPWFYPLSLAANTVMIIKAVNFHLDPKTYCRSCFVFSYMWLGAVLLLLGVNHMQPLGRFCALIGWVDLDEEATPAVAAAADMSSGKAVADASNLRVLREQSPVVALAGGPKAL